MISSKDIFDVFKINEAIKKGLLIFEENVIRIPESKIYVMNEIINLIMWGRMKIIKLMRGLYKYIILMLIFNIIQVYCELKLPKIMSLIVDTGISTKDFILIKNEAILMIVITIICLISNILVVFATSKFSNKYGFNIRKLYAKINSFSKEK